MGGIEAEGRAACDGVADVAAESCLEFFVDEGVGDFQERDEGVRPAATSSRCFAPVARAQREEAALDAGFGGFLLGDLADFFKDARHSNEDGGLDSEEGLRELVEAIAVGDEHVFRVEGVVEVARGDVREREERDAGVGGVEAELGEGVVDVAGDVAVGEEHAFGLAGGAGGVDESGEVGGLDGAGGFVEGGIVLAAAGDGGAQ